MQGCQPTIEAASLNASPLQEAKDAVSQYQSLPVQHLLAAVCYPAISCHNWLSIVLRSYLAWS